MDTRRLILVMIFTFSSFMLWESWQKHNAPKPAPNVAAQGEAGAVVPQPSASLQAAGPGTTPAAPAAAAPAGGETFTVTTDLLKATIATQGGDIAGLELLKYREHDAKDKNFLLFDPKHSYRAQSGLIGPGLPSHRTQLTRVPGPTEMAEGSDELKIRLEAPAENGVKATKVLTFRRGSYIVDVAWRSRTGATSPSRRMPTTSSSAMARRRRARP